MNKEQTLNEAELQAKVHERLTANGVEITKTAVDQVMDTMTDIVGESLVAGVGVKFRGLGSIEVRDHREKAYKVPDGNGGFITGVRPAGRHIGIDSSDAIDAALNPAS